MNMLCSNRKREAVWPRGRSQGLMATAPSSSFPDQTRGCSCRRPCGPAASCGHGSRGQRLRFSSESGASSRNPPTCCLRHPVPIRGHCIFWKPGAARASPAQHSPACQRQAPRRPVSASRPEAELRRRHPESRTLPRPRAPSAGSAAAGVFPGPSTLPAASRRRREGRQGLCGCG